LAARARLEVSSACPELARQAAQLVRVREPLCFDVQGFQLAVARRRALDFFDHVPQVVRLAVHVLASRGEVLLASLELVQALACIAHRGPLHGRIGVGIEHVALRVGSQQGLGFVLTVQVHEERTELARTPTVVGLPLTHARDLLPR